MNRPKIFSFHSRWLFSEEDGDTLWQGPPWKFVRVFLLSLAMILAALFALLVYGHLDGGATLGLALRDALYSMGEISVWFLPLILIVLHNRTRIRARDDGIERRHGRFPPYFTTKIPFEEFEGVRFWLDADGGWPGSRLLRKDKTQLAAMATIELVHPKQKNITTALRVFDDHWWDRAQFGYGHDFGLPLFVPGSTEGPKHFTSEEEFGAAVHQEMFNVDEAALTAGKNVRYKQKRNGITSIRFPYAPFDLIHSLSYAPLYYGAIALVVVVVNIFDDGFGLVLNNLKAFSVIASALAALVFIPPLIDSTFTRRIDIGGATIKSGVKINGKRPRVALSEIIGFSVGRRVRRASHLQGTYALFALTEDGATPLAYGMTEQTYGAVLNGCKKACREFLMG